ncbi:2-dehydro-3-deoxygalactonokinase [Paenibacillus sophorae]|uniref:2-dehydro-3-deoxygalactonokinase n=1 Tax=Paenibacillus sophorae TaxID=1333845 RepID=A0A1H8IYL7_9BACL|nr:2-dehydro-3-deoxygalactonokinase [Paenibacillus sophorae]QWU16107.1 2-dehydro-3-deoxygalactonokinase [Paenibacillus sophorae]SEN72778.1 2-dehydro-3-deoxygalactonokinase [Paenibacillus sophorae]
MYAITIDTGTTNTRVNVWRDNEVVAEAFQPVGVRDTAITGSRQKLTQGVKTAIEEAMRTANVKTGDSVVILASGMITSNVGLYEIPHVPAPAGIQELAAAMVKAELPEIIDQPIWFVPGVKNNVPDLNLDTCETMDIMRGEEVEVVGITQKLQLEGPAVLILPGSHSKVVRIDGDNRITGCMTTIAGELLDVITKQTILANALQSSFAGELEEAVLLKGAAYAEKVGLGRTCFTVRILDMFSDLSINEKANFLLGAVLQADILAVKNSGALNVTPLLPVVVFGKELLREALIALIKHDPFFTGPVHSVGNEHKALAGFGALAIARERGILHNAQMA